MRSLSIDILKIILAFFVMFLHMHLLRNVYPSLSYVLVNGLFRTAVPVFLIITGYYFYYVDDIQKLKKWLIRIFILYTIWTVIYIPLWKEKDSYIANIIFGFHHLWYLIGTFFSGIVLFAFRKISVKILFSLILFFFRNARKFSFLILTVSPIKSSSGAGKFFNSLLKTPPILFGRSRQRACAKGVPAN